MRPYHPHCLHEGDTELLENVSVAVEPPPPSLLRRRPAIEIQLQRSKFPTPEASHQTISKQTEGKRETKRIRERATQTQEPKVGWLTSCSAVRPTYSSAGHEFFR